MRAHAWMSIALVALPVAAPLLLVERRASAICGALPPAIVVPTLRHAAPLNAHVWVTLPEGWRTTGLCDAFISGKPCPTSKYTLGVRRAPTLAHERPWVKGSERESPRAKYLLPNGAGSRTVELAPEGALDANAMYEVRLRSDAASDDVIGVFQTGDFTDASAPTWGAETTPTGAYAHAPLKPGQVLLSECGEPTASFQKLSPLDDRTAPADLRFEVRVHDRGEPSDLLRAPDAVASSFPDGRNGFYVWLGNSDETSDDGVVPRDQHHVTVSLTIIDWAGNRSDERSFDL